MINKADEIRKRLRQGWTTRKIAQELRVSLRDIHRVREQENIDIGALERQKTRIEKDIADLNSDIAQKRSTLTRLEKQINDLERTKTNLEAAIEKKQTEIKYVRQPVEPIYFAQNYGDVRKNLETLSSDQLGALSQIITDILNDRAVRAIRDERSKIRKKTEDTINQMRNSLRS